MKSLNFPLSPPSTNSEVQQPSHAMPRHATPSQTQLNPTQPNPKLCFEFQYLSELPSQRKLFAMIYPNTNKR